MEKLLLLQIFFLFACLASNGQASIESRIADHFVEIKDETDFSALDEILKDKRIVILGECGHQDGTTFEIRSRLTRHLIDDLGFDVLGLESAGFLGSKMLPDVSEQLSGKVFDLKSWDLAYLWNNTVECREIMEAVLRKEIPFFGFDYDKAWYTPLLLDNLLSSVFPEFHKTFDVQSFGKIFYNTLGWHNPENEQLSAEEDIYYCNVLSEIENLCHKSLYEKTDGNRLADLILQSLKFFRTVYLESKLERDYSLDFGDDYNATWHSNNLRDEYMADNIIWYLERNPDKKMVIWCANFHGAKDISQVEYPKLPGYYTRLKLMAEFLAEKYGDQLYSLAFTSHRGNPDDIESILFDRNVDMGFIDFTALRYSDEFFNKPFKTSLIMYKSGYWMNVFDGIIFHKYNLPSTLITQPE